MVANCCYGCALPLPAGQRRAPRALFGHCQQQGFAFTATVAVFHYRSPVDYLIQGLKFNG